LLGDDAMATEKKKKKKGRNPSHGGFSQFFTVMQQFIQHAFVGHDSDLHLYVLQPQLPVRLTVGSSPFAHGVALSCSAIFTKTQI
jgi:hypothetical protein